MPTLEELRARFAFNVDVEEVPEPELTEVRIHTASYTLYAHVAIPRTSPDYISAVLDSFRYSISSLKDDKNDED